MPYIALFLSRGTPLPEFFLPDDRVDRDINLLELQGSLNTVESIRVDEMNFTDRCLIKVTISDLVTSGSMPEGVITNRMKGNMNKDIAINATQTLLCMTNKQKRGELQPTGDQTGGRPTCAYALPIGGVTKQIAFGEYVKTKHILSLQHMGYSLYLQLLHMLRDTGGWGPTVSLPDVAIVCWPCNVSLGIVKRLAQNLWTLECNDLPPALEVQHSTSLVYDIDIELGDIYSYLVFCRRLRLKDKKLGNTCLSDWSPSVRPAWVYQTEDTQLDPKEPLTMTDIPPNQLTLTDPEYDITPNQLTLTDPEYDITPNHASAQLTPFIWDVRMGAGLASLGWWRAMELLNSRTDWYRFGLRRDGRIDCAAGQTVVSTHMHDKEPLVKSIGEWRPTKDRTQPILLFVPCQSKDNPDYPKGTPCSNSCRRLSVKCNSLCRSIVMSSEQLESAASSIQCEYVCVHTWGRVYAKEIEVRVGDRGSPFCFSLVVCLVTFTLLRLWVVALSVPQRSTWINVVSGLTLGLTIMGKPVFNVDVSVIAFRAYALMEQSKVFMIDPEWRVFKRTADWAIIAAAANLALLLGNAKQRSLAIYIESVILGVLALLTLIVFCQDTMRCGMVRCTSMSFDTHHWLNVIFKSNSAKNKPGGRYFMVINHEALRVIEASYKTAQLNSVGGRYSYIEGPVRVGNNTEPVCSGLYGGSNHQ
jgi:hypothetical protein